ncbi:MAG TPA: ATP-grasp domain-containing protein [Gaiellaceae bacterium]|nr:ATP-grasp domain-containing protein [Gaiellaceae bacterium]
MAGRPGSRRARLLVLGAGPAQLGLLETAAGRRELELIAVDRDPAAPGFTLADERALLSTEDEPGVERLARAREVDGLVSPGADWPVGVAARVAERLALAHPVDAATAAAATSKARQRELFAAHGVPHARSFAPQELGLRFPCVVKAPDRQGQRGLSLVRQAGELEAALAEASAESRSGGVLLEELVEGPEVTVNAVFVDGEQTVLTVTDRELADPPAFGVALAHVWPSRAATPAAVDAALAAARAVGIRSGPAYVQVRLGADGPRVMEVAARLGGGHDAELCEAALGVDLNGLAIDFALGRGVSVPDVSEGLTLGHVPRRRARRREPASEARLGGMGPSASDTAEGLTLGHGRYGQSGAPGGACVRFLVGPAGVLRAVEGVEEAAAVEGVRWVRLYRRPGHRFGPLRRGADRAGAILAVGATREEALERAARAAQAVRFRVDVDPA